MSAVSSTFRAHLLHALGEERHFALVDGLRFSNLGSVLIVRALSAPTITVSERQIGQPITERWRRN
jgi:hypothetical protein